MNYDSKFPSNFEQTIVNEMDTSTKPQQYTVWRETRAQFLGRIECQKRSRWANTEKCIISAYYNELLYPSEKQGQLCSRSLDHSVLRQQTAI